MLVSAPMPDVAGDDDLGGDDRCDDMIQTVPTRQQGLQQRQHREQRGCASHQQRPGRDDHRHVGISRSAWRATVRGGQTGLAANSVRSQGGIGVLALVTGSITTCTTRQPPTATPRWLTSRKRLVNEVVPIFSTP